MATYQELFAVLHRSVTGAGELRDKVAVAVLIAADKISSGSDTGPPFGQGAGAHDKRVLWAQRAYAGPRAMAEQVFAGVIAANASASQAAIIGASDASIQSAVDAIVDALAATPPVSP